MHIIIFLSSTDAPPSWHAHAFRVIDFEFYLMCLELKISFRRMQGVREGSIFTPYRERFAYDVANLRYRYLAGLEDERELAYAHYFFYKEVWLDYVVTL